MNMFKTSKMAVASNSTNSQVETREKRTSIGTAFGQHRHVCSCIGILRSSQRWSEIEEERIRIDSFSLSLCLADINNKQLQHIDWSACGQQRPWHIRFLYPARRRELIRSRSRFEDSCSRCHKEQQIARRERRLDFLVCLLRAVSSEIWRNETACNYVLPSLNRHIFKEGRERESVEKGNETRSDRPFSSRPTVWKRRILIGDENCRESIMRNPVEIIYKYIIGKRITAILWHDVSCPGTHWTAVEGIWMSRRQLTFDERSESSGNTYRCVLVKIDLFSLDLAQDRIEKLLEPKTVPGLRERGKRRAYFLVSATKLAKSDIEDDNLW